MIELLTIIAVVLLWMVPSYLLYREAYRFSFDVKPADRMLLVVLSVVGPLPAAIVFVMEWLSWREPRSREQRIIKPRRRRNEL